MVTISNPPIVVTFPFIAGGTKGDHKSCVKLEKLLTAFLVDLRVTKTKPLEKEWAVRGYAGIRNFQQTESGSPTRRELKLALIFSSFRGRKFRKNRQLVDYLWSTSTL